MHLLEPPALSTPVTKATMVFATRFFTLALLTLPSFAAPAHLNHTKRAAKPYDGIHLVLLRDGVSLTEVVGSLSPPSRVTSQWDIINGFACYLSTKDLPTLMDHPGVVTIQKNRDITPEGVILTQYVAFAWLSPGRVNSRAM